MPEAIEEIIADIKDTGNRGESPDLWIPRKIREAGYLTGTFENPKISNQLDSYTRAGNLPKIHFVISITADETKEIDLAPELSLTEAAEIARKFFKKLPEDLLEADLGSGF